VAVIMISGTRRNKAVPGGDGRRVSGAGRD